MGNDHILRSGAAESVNVKTAYFAVLSTRSARWV
jgi:hypothetical protein